MCISFFLGPDFHNPLYLFGHGFVKEPFAETGLSRTVWTISISKVIQVWHIFLAYGILIVIKTSNAEALGAIRRVFWFWCFSVVPAYCDL
jgi:hypothetical protein